MTGQIVNQELYLKYTKCITIVEVSHAETSQSVSAYWWALYEIYRDDLWKAVTDDGNFTTWLGDLTHAPFGTSTQTFYSRMKAIKKWFALGMDDEKIKLLLGSSTEMALSADIEGWFQKNGELKPEVKKQIEDGHETPPEYLVRVSQLSPSDARQEVQRLVVKDKVFPIPDDCSYNVNTGELLFVMRWDSEDDGLMWKGTVRVTATQSAPEETGEVYMPEIIARYLAKRLGLRL